MRDNELVGPIVLRVAQCALVNGVTVLSVHPMGVKATLVAAILTSARMDRVPRH